jgi:hypothetical protein
MDPAEVYKWDTQGHLVLRGVMDPQWIGQAVEALRTHPDAHTIQEHKHQVYTALSVRYALNRYAGTDTSKYSTDVSQSE